MSQICFENISNLWTSFEDIVGSEFSESVTYKIQNRGYYPIIAQESNSLPE